MYHKAIVFDDQEIADKIVLEPEPSKQKAMGRKVKGFDHSKWNAKREKIVEDGNWWKFTQPKEGDLRKMLVETGDRLLVEASPYDRIWGIGYGAADAVSALFRTIYPNLYRIPVASHVLGARQSSCSPFSLYNLSPLPHRGLTNSEMCRR